MVPSAPVIKRLALANERGESKLLFPRRNKRVVAVRTHGPKAIGPASASAAIVIELHSTFRFSALPRRLPADLAREFVRPRQRRLTGERRHQHRGAGGVSRTNRKLQSIAHKRSHLLMLRDDFHRGLPPPSRSGRSIRFRNGSPLRKFANSPLEVLQLDASFASGSQYCGLHHLVATRSVGPRRPERAGHLKNALTSSARRSTLSVPRILASLGTLI
jgi:hypothetical protein